MKMLSSFNTHPHFSNLKDFFFHGTKKKSIMYGAPKGTFAKIKTYRLYRAHEKNFFFFL